MYANRRHYNWLTCSYTTSNISNKSKSNKKRGKKGVALAKPAAAESPEKATEYYVNKCRNKPNRKFASNRGSETTLTNNETKDITKKFRSLKNRGILIKGTEKLLAKKEDFLIFLGH